MKALFSVAATLIAAASSASAQESGSIAAPQPAPPLLKSGSFSCTMYTEENREFELEGKVGNWEAASSGGGNVGFLLSAPEQDILSGEYQGYLGHRSWSFQGFDTKSGSSTEAKLSSAYLSRGTLAIERGRPLARYSDSDQRQLFVGFCDFDFSSELRSLEK